MLRKMKRAIARKRMINAGWVRLNHKDDPVPNAGKPDSLDEVYDAKKRSKFAKHWRDFV